MKTPYIIVSASNIGALANFVNYNISLGYIPVGGIAIDWNNERFGERYVQAMVLKASL